MRIADMNWMQVRDHAAQDDRAILPIGSTEQHAYLSLAVDANEEKAEDNPSPYQRPETIDDLVNHSVIGRSGMCWRLPMPLKFSIQRSVIMDEAQIKGEACDKVVSMARTELRTEDSRRTNRNVQPTCENDPLQYFIRLRLADSPV